MPWVKGGATTEEGQVRRAFVYRLYPTKQQTEALEQLLDTARHLYNAALQERRDAWKQQRVSVNYYDQQRELKELRRDLPEVGMLNHMACCGVLMTVDHAYQAFFRRLKAGQKPGYPRFRNWHRFDSITFPDYDNGVRIKDDRLYVQNVGSIKVKWHRPIGGTPKSVVLRRLCGKWQVAISCAVPAQSLPPSLEELGIDVGIESFATTSNGQHIANPHYLEQGQAALTEAQRKLCRRKKGSHRRRKAAALVAKHHLKVKRQRTDFAHKLARGLVTDYGFLAVEDLNIQGMVRNHHLARSISDASWGQFITILSAKAEEAGRECIKVNPNGTSQACSGCGAIVKKALSVRQHVCPDCGLSIHRDVNAAINILRLGQSLRSSGREPMRTAASAFQGAQPTRARMSLGGYPM